MYCRGRVGERIRICHPPSPLLPPHPNAAPTYLPTSPRPPPPHLSSLLTPLPPTTSSTQKTAKICRVLRACRGVDFYVWDTMSKIAELDVWVSNPQVCKDENHRMSEVIIRTSVRVGAMGRVR